MIDERGRILLKIAEIHPGRILEGVCMDENKNEMKNIMKFLILLSFHDDMLCFHRCKRWRLLRIIHIIVCY